jgi:hypothetical protein
LIFANYKKAYGTRGYEAKTLIIIIKNKKSTPGHAIASLVWSQPHDILQNGSPPFLTKPKTELESSLKTPMPIQNL